MLSSILDKSVAGFGRYAATDEAVARLRAAPGPSAVLVGLSVGAPVVLDVARALARLLSMP
jgi:hypothetical protein